MGNLQYTIPISIVAAGVLVAGAIFISGTGGGSSTIAAVSQSGSTSGFGNSLSVTADNITPVSKDEHIRGDVNAKVSIVEFSDLECPFCRRLHPTLTRIVDEFDGEVNWVYRHFPLTSIHSRTLAASLASECVAALGGNDAFWSFVDGAFDNQSRLGDSLYRGLAQQAGVSLDAFNACYDAREYSDAVQTDYQNALDSGGRGTPFVVVVNGNGETFPFSGALEYSVVKQIIETAITSS